ncbi:response regulator [Allorhodopirellula heiligendammensis]|uniref:Alkaline phosphatase synthesis transcriptional regulatory protein PhoP n=1 Tax=Allorhodopirellula heiligendammensis TaxID=2714739 RepID=A0A5C6BX89_9BACT|nr:response regulator [Allorhodopirellula heiligendammensis]TWU15896.1 Alkaline phosphatase synthesis transcriptional regulatory protein PhoP [Allorhodopirellula heiligendammensis]
MTEPTLVLAVDDSMTQVTGMQLLLQQHGYEVMTAANGQLALEAVRQRRPDLVVTDLQMPEMDGLQLVAALRQEFSGLPIILTTGKGSEEIAAKALRLGASSYVPKRTLNEDLVPTIERMMSMVDVAEHRTQQSTLLTSIRLELSLGNDDIQVPNVIARLEQPLSELGLLDDTMQMQISTALDEALINAIIHGNLEISTAQRYEGTDEQFRELVRERQRQAPYRDRNVTIAMDANREEVTFNIRDQGPGFDVSSLPDPTDFSNLGECGGRGLLLINAFMDKVIHRNNGNEIVMSKKKGDASLESD